MDKSSIMFQINDVNLAFFKFASKRYKDLNVTPVHSRIIMEIFSRKEKLCQKDLEDLMECNKSTVSAILNTMEKNGLIRREDSLVDFRKKNIILTKKSKEIVKVLEKDKIILDEILGENITDDEYIIFSEVLKKLKSNIERI